MKDIEEGDKGGFLDSVHNRGLTSQFDPPAHSTTPISRSDPKVVGQTAF